ncbi:hypothetical protein QM012_001633 [Aureobasidium pullulans]|uniref:Uncharacterized protein n=1 Tax=Aureobasidium pullulans TaxID=5580 RepID=A0ABR0TEN0_AURPU
MARIRDSRKRSSQVLEGAANKRIKRTHNETGRCLEPGDLLRDVVASADHLSPSLVSTMSAFVRSGADVEAQTSRWRHLVKTVWEIGVAQTGEDGAVDGQIAQSTLNLLLSAWSASPYRGYNKSPKPSTDPANATRPELTVQESRDSQDEHQDLLYFDLGEDTTTAYRRGAERLASGNSPQLPSVQVKKSTKQRAGAMLPHEGTPTWHTTWALAIRPHEETTLAAGLTSLIIHCFTHESVNEVVNLLEDIHHNKDTIAINNESKTVQELRSSNDQAQEVALKYKALWSATESAALSQCGELFAYHDLGVALSRLEAELDQIGRLPANELGDFARKYLEDRRQGSRLRDTEMTRARFVPRHLLEVLGYGKESQYSDAEMKEKKRMLKSQRMTAKNMKAFVDCFGEGCLLLMYKCPWSSALPQVSGTKLKPLLDQLVAEEPELREMAQLAGAFVRYVKDRHTILDMPKIVIRAQEWKVEQRGRFSILELLSPPEPEEQADLTSDEVSDDERELYCNAQ